MATKINIDENEFFKDAMPMMTEYQSFLDWQVKQHNTAVLSVIGFIIATCWIIITSEGATQWTKYLLSSSIILLTVWLLLWFIASGIQLKNYNDVWIWILNWHKNKTLEEAEENAEELTNKIRPWKGINNTTKVWAWLQLLWIVSFLIWLVIFMFSF